jgi:GAF domain-containing protein
VSAEFGALGVIDPEHDALEDFIYVGLSEEDARRIGDLPTGHGLLGALIADPRAIRLPQMESDPRAVGFPAHHPEMESFLGVPVRVRDDVFGNLYLTNSRDGVFSEEDERLVEALAATAGFAIENARLLERARTRERWTSAAATLSATLLASPTPTAFDLIANQMFDLPDIDKVAVVVVDDATATTRVVAVRGIDDAALLGRVLHPDSVCSDEALEFGYTASRVRGPSDGDLTRVVEGELAGPVVAAPLQSRGRSFGAVCAARTPKHRRFSSTEIESIGDLTSRAAIALELAHAREDNASARPPE